jgi:hypothetical protein
VRGEDTFIGHLERAKKDLCSRVESRRTVIQGDLGIGGEGLSPRDQFSPEEKEASVSQQQQVQWRIDPYKSCRERRTWAAGAEGSVHTRTIGAEGRVHVVVAMLYCGGISASQQIKLSGFVVLFCFYSQWEIFPVRDPL